MSSLRNAVKRITHKERSQPTNRAKLGILEKKKDYKLRAIDYHRKDERIKQMKEKASMRNIDEFYFGMNKSKINTNTGQHTTIEDNQLSEDVIRLMKDQDLSYIRMHKQTNQKKVEKLQSTLHYLNDNDDDTQILLSRNKKNKKQKSKHTIFVDTKEDAKTFNVAKHFDTHPDLVGRSFNRPRLETIKKVAIEKAKAATLGGRNNKKRKFQNDDDEDDDSDDNTMTKQKISKNQLKKTSIHEKRQLQKIAKARSVAYGELEARIQRTNTMKLAEDHLVTEKLVRGKGRKRKINAAEDGKPAQYRWRRKRLG